MPTRRGLPEHEPPEPKANVLLVDDTPANLLALEAILDDLGHNLVTATSGEEALRLLLGRDFAVVLLDVRMPGLDGFETAKLIRGRERSRHTPIIFLTAHDSDGPTVEQAYALGAVDYLVKPLVPVSLRAKVAGFVELFEKTEQIKGQAERLRQVEHQHFESRLAEENARLRESEARLRLLWEAAAVLLSADDPDAMLRGLFEKVKGHLGVDAYLNFMVNEAGDALRLASCAGVHEEMARSVSRLEFGQAVCGTAALERRPLIATHIQQSQDEKVRLVKGFGIRVYACNPLLVEGQLLGTLSFASRSKDTFDADEVGFLETVTHYVTAAYERLRLIRQLRQADRRKDEFLAMLAHELRSPLAPLTNGIHILRLYEANRKGVEEARGLMERQVRHLGRIVDDLLEVSRVTRGKLGLRPERLDLTRLVRSTAEDQRHVFEQAGLGLELELPELPVWVQGDPTRLAQVLGNLLQNAAKFTDRGGKVAVRVGVDAAGQRAVLTVRDTGIGIEPGMLPRLFDAFAQADRSLDRSKGGLGLGLALVKGLVELHGGEVQAASEGVGRGAEFTVRLPRQPDPPAPTAMPAAPGRAAKRLRILVVEDSRDAADSLKLLLELFGYDVAVAYSGPAGVKAAEDWHPDVVLCDIGLPGMSGYEVAGALRRNPATAKARMIAVTGYGGDEDRRRSQEAGFDAHLTKPADPAALQDLVASPS